MTAEFSLGVVVDSLHQDPQGAGEEAHSEVLSAPPWSKRLVPRARLPVCSQFPQVMQMLNQCSGHGSILFWGAVMQKWRGYILFIAREKIIAA